MNIIHKQFLGYVARIAFIIAVSARETASYGGLHQASEPEELKSTK